MASIINSNTGKIENWRIYVKNKHNGICVKLISEFQDMILNNKDVWFLVINNHEFKTSNIKSINLNDLSIITQSGSKYYLGESDNNNFNIEFLKQYFNNQ